MAANLRRVMREIGELAVEEAARRLDGIVVHTPLEESKRLSKRYGARVLLKREDRQEIRSFKIRGAYNKIRSLTDEEKARGVVCASAGNHAQGVAFACASLGIRASIFMPEITPNQKIERVKQFGGGLVEVRLVGASYDDANAAATAHCAQAGAVFVHPFNDPVILAGQATVGLEIQQALPEVEVVVVPVGGGGLAAGIASHLKASVPGCAVYGAEPAGSPSMYEALRAGRVVTLDEIDTFVDGAAVKTTGELTFDLCRRHLDRVVLVPEGQVCTAVIELYQNEGVIAEPAGALAVSALDQLADEIRGRTTVCIVSGGNNDILRYPEIVERSLVHQGRKHYFIVEFTQKPGQLRRFVDLALGPTDDIVRFEYMKKTNKERGAALVGIELRDKADLEPLLARLHEIDLNYRLLTAEDLLYEHIV
jgi:threonine dehydratase